MILIDLQEAFDIIDHQVLLKKIKYINDLSQGVVSDMLLYVDDTCIVFQHKSTIEIEKQQIRDFMSFCDCFVDNKLSIHFKQDKTKSILFGIKHKLWNAKSLSIV